MIYGVPGLMREKEKGEAPSLALKLVFKSGRA